MGGAASIPSSLNAVASRLRPIDASLAARRRPNTEAPDANVAVLARLATELDDVHNPAALAVSPPPARDPGAQKEELPPLPPAAPVLPAGLSNPVPDGDFAASEEGHTESN